MKKLIRPTYPLEFTLGILLLIFFIAFLLSLQIFAVPFHDLNDKKEVYFGMFLASAAVIIMIVIIWEEFLFPIKAKEAQGGMIFTNHRKKLRTQALIYCIIPAIFIFIYLEYEINLFRFVIWAAVCMIAPIAEKLVSGITNYNDFLLLTDAKIEYKNNQKEGRFETKNIENIIILEDERNISVKIQLVFKDHTNVIIDLDEMELDAFYDAIRVYIVSHYKHSIREISSENN